VKKVSVEVLEDASHPEGGYAVLLLRGVASLPDGATFRLKPVEARGNNDTWAGEAWPQGELTPRAIRASTGGIEILVGPDIVECPALLPGTLGVVEVRSAGVRGEFLWPSIKPTARPRRRNLTVVKPTRPVPASAASKSNAGSPSGEAALVAATRDPFGHAVPARMLRDGSGGGLANQPAMEAGTAHVPVTALDHEVPASATVAEAIGANVVQFSSARDAAHIAAKPDDEENATTGGATAPPSGVAASSLQHALSRRGTFWAASIALLISGTILVLGGNLDFWRPAEPDDRTTPTPPAEAVRALQAVTSPAAPAAGLRGDDAATSPPQQREAAGAAEPLEQQPMPESGAQTAAQQTATSTTTAPGVAAAPVPVPEVTLRMRGGGFQIAGELRGFDGAKYVIATRSAGVLTMDASRFECLGEACGRPAAAILPLSERPSPVKPDVFRIEGAASLAAEFIPQLIRDYANSIGATVAEQRRETGRGTTYRILDQRGVELAAIEVNASGSTSGLLSLERGAAAIALVDKALMPDAEPRAIAAVRGRVRQPVAAQQTEIVVGLDGITAVASAASAPPSISIDNLAKVAAGQITDWYELGQSPGAIHLYLPPDGSGSTESFARQVLKPRGLDYTRTARRMPSEAEAADAAAKDPRGLAIVSLAAQRGARAINLETTCGLVVRPTSFAVKTGEYPLVRRLSLQLAPQLAQPSARGLVRVAQSGDVVGAIGAGRIIDQSIASLPIEEQGERMAWAANAPPSAFDAAELRQMLNDLDGASRLSVTFRFVPGTNELEPRSRREIQRLASALKEPELAGKRIVLAGFTDGAGRFQANMAAASRRAAQVRSLLLQAAGAGLDSRLVQSKGYGPLAPVGCNGSPEGTRLNRRVEAWVAG
jgi:phosphate transport system substrate-binding protein